MDKEGTISQQEKDFWVECNVCKHRLKNWVGSTPCCGSIAYLVEDDGTVGKDFTLYGSVNNSPIKPLIINHGEVK